MQIHTFRHFPGLLIETVLVNHSTFQSGSQLTVGSGSLDDLRKYPVSASLAGRHGGPSASEWAVKASQALGTKPQNQERSPNSSV